MAEQWMPGASRQPQPGGVTLNTGLPRRATWHITWDAVTNGNQPPMANVSNYLKNQGYCPHLMWDPFTGDVIQYYPANVGGRALNAWNEDGAVNIQIETYFSPGVTHNGRAYQTVAETPCKGLDKILAWLDSHGIPRVWPMGAPQWQGNPRDVGIWNTKAGHYGHCNVPDNTHTDPGPMPSLGKSGTKPQSGTVTPIKEKDWFDTMTPAEKKALLDAAAKVARYLDAPIGVVPGKVADAILNESITRANVGGQTSLRSTVAYLDSNLAALRNVIEQLAKGQGVTIDYGKVEAAVKSALKDGTVQVDVTVAGAK